MNRQRFLKWVYCRGSEGHYVAAEGWREQLVPKGIRCPVCDALREGGIHRLEALVVAHHHPKLAVSSVAFLYGGLVMRTDLIDIVGIERLRDLCHFRPVVLECGTELKDFRYLVEKSPRGCFRGEKDSEIWLCKECGRLLYGPIPLEKRYLLRAYWDGDDEVTVLGSGLLCTPQYLQEVLVPHRFPKLTGQDRAFADTPADGLPIAYDDLVAEVRRRGWFTP